MAGRIGREQQRQGITIAWYPAFCARLACSFTREYGILNSTNLANVFVKSFFIDFPIFFWKKGALN